MPTKKKIKKVEQLKEKFEAASSVFFTDYHGLDVNEINELRQNLVETGAEFTIAKNTLLRVVDPKITLTGPTAVLFTKGDPLAALKVVAKFKSKFSKPTFKFAFFEGGVLNETQIEELAMLPSKELLLGKLAYILNAPISGFARVLNANQHKLVATLGEISKKKGSL